MNTEHTSTSTRARSFAVPVALSLLILLVIAVIVGSGRGREDAVVTEPVAGENARIEDGVQIVEIYAKGGYRPESSVATSGIPTVLRFVTEGSFDCSTSLRIPELELDRTLPLTGVVDIDVGTRTKGVLSGSCSMGMYHFSVEFR